MSSFPSVPKPEGGRAPQEAAPTTQPSASRPVAWVDFAAPCEGAEPVRGVFVHPFAVHQARRPEEVVAVLQAAEAAARTGRWCVGYVAYEAAPAFDPAFEVHEPATGGLPLAWFAEFEALEPWPTAAGHVGYEPLHWASRLGAEAFARNIARIHQAIADGEVYQINYTAPWTTSFQGDPLALFHALLRAQPHSYAACLDTGAGHVLSLSPELFFDWRDERLLARPMKGTAPRGETPEEDLRRAEGLRTHEKERAENLMIVDLIRNDLSRLAEAHSVRVPRLFHTQAWPTVWQMTSDVVCRTRPGTTLVDVFRALFPCGSVTGAPKVRAMHWIHRLETEPRGVYCGAVGLLQPGGVATFNVAIRTVEVGGQQARCGIGSGITADARAAAEYEEWRVKRGFLERAARPFQLLETMRVSAGQVVRWAYHRARLERAARHFRYPWDADRVEREVSAAASILREGRLRLLLGADGALALEPGPLPVTPPRPVVVLAFEPIDGSSEFVRHKTTRREHYERLALEEPAVFDTLLWNARGELTEFTRGNVAVRIEGQWYTPPESCGLLPGVMRQSLIDAGKLLPRVLRREDLRRAQGLAFVNSLRGWVDVTLEDRTVRQRR